MKYRFYLKNGRDFVIYADTVDMDLPVKVSWTDGKSPLPHLVDFNRDDISAIVEEDENEK